MTESKLLKEAGPAVDPAASARAAGLRYVHHDRPGLRRVRSGRGFRSVGPDGRAVRDPETLRRIRFLAGGSWGGRIHKTIAAAPVPPA